MRNHQKISKVFFLVYWLVLFVRMFIDTADSSDMPSTLLIALILGMLIAVIARIKIIPVTVKSTIFIVSTIIFEMYLAYFSERFVIAPLMAAVLAVFACPLLKPSVVLAAGLAGNVSGLVFCILFNDIAFKYISVSQTIYLFVLMNAVLLFCLFIVLWTNTQLKKSKEIALEADRMSAAKDDFLASVSHEIRTPLNAIFGMTEIVLAAKENTSVSELKNETKCIKTAGYELLTLINSVLDISKIEQGQMFLIEIPYKVTDLFRDIENSIKAKLDEKPVSLNSEYDLRVSDCLVGDDVRIKQICMNLLLNAVKYTEKGFIGFTVSQVKSDTGADLLITVSDTGVGIREDEISKILKHQHKLDIRKSKKTEGMGFGIPIAFKLLDMMKGTISVNSRFGEGTEIKIVIPQKIASSEIISDEISLNKPQARNSKVLVVDDNYTNIEIAKGLFKLYDIDIYTALSGKEAVDKAMIFEYDIIFMDHMMPDMDGVEAAKEIRKLNNANSSVPIVALTANCDKEHEEYFMRSGMTAFMAKPIIVEELERVLKTWLNASKYPQADNTECVPEKPDIPGVDVSRGIKNCGGTLAAYIDVLNVFYTSGISRIEQMQKSFNRGDIERIAVEANSLKKVTKGIGAEKLSDKALILENAAKNREKNVLSGNIGNTLSEYRKLLDDISSILNKQKEKVIKKDISLDKENLINKLELLWGHVNNYALDEADIIANELMQYTFDIKIEHKLKEIKKCISFFSYEDTAKSAEMLISELKEGNI